MSRFKEHKQECSTLLVVPEIKNKVLFFADFKLEDDSFSYDYGSQTNCIEHGSHIEQYTDTKWDTKKYNQSENFIIMEWLKNNEEFVSEEMEKDFNEGYDDEQQDFFDDLKNDF